MTANGLHDAERTYNQYRELIGSMIGDQGKINDNFVKVWLALGTALRTADNLEKLYLDQLERINILEKSRLMRDSKQSRKEGRYEEETVS